MVIFEQIGHFGAFRKNDQSGSLELISMHQKFKGGPKDGQDELEPNRSYLNHIAFRVDICFT